MSATPQPQLNLPGQAFTIWTRPPVVAAPVATPPRNATPPRGGGKISLPGKQFTIWTRSASAVVRPGRLTALIPACCAPKETGAARGSSTWVTRAALLAVPFMGALWYSDHKSQSSRVEAISQNHAADELLKTQFQDQASTLSQQLTQRSQAMAQMIAKEEATSKSMNEVKAALTATEETARSKAAELATVTEKLAALSKELSTVKSSFGSKEEAWNNSIAAMKEEASKARQTLEQKELEMKNILAKVEGERAAAQKEAASAALKAQELAAELEAMRKKLPAEPKKQ